MKRCSICRKEKALEDFHRDRRASTGRCSLCKDCERARFHKKRPPRKPLTEPQREKRRVQRAPYWREYKKRPNVKKKTKAWLKKFLKGKGKFKAESRAKTHKAIRDGVLKRLPCEVCGAPKTDGHHMDYSKPLEIKWLCRKHHHEIHGQIYHLATTS